MKCIGILILFSDLFISGFDIMESYFVIIKDHRIRTNFTRLRHTETGRVTECANHCVKQQNCAAANFKTSSKTCELHQFDNSKGYVEIMAETENRVILKKGFNTFNYTNSWVYHGASDCYFGNINDYKGEVNVTVNGNICQNWNVDSPHTVNEKPYNTEDHDTNYCRTSPNEVTTWCYTTNTNARWEYCAVVPCTACGVVEHLPEAPPNTTLKTVITKNIKIAVDFECLTLETGTSVNHCPASVCREDSNQWSTGYTVSCTNEDCYTVSADYKGKVSCTLDGTPCQYWNSSVPHSPNYSLTDPVDQHSNYCRDPSGDGKPWCYTTDSSIRWDFCPVKKC